MSIPNHRPYCTSNRDMTDWYLCTSLNKSPTFEWYVCICMVLLYSQDFNGQSVLHQVCKYGRQELLHYLLSLNVELNPRTPVTVCWISLETFVSNCVCGMYSIIMDCSIKTGQCLQVLLYVLVEVLQWHAIYYCFHTHCRCALLLYIPGMQCLCTHLWLP